MQPVLVYSQELAVKAGGGDFLSQGGAYVLKITEAKYVSAQTGSAGIQFSVLTKEGQNAKFINVYYAKKPVSQGVPGEPISGGLSCLNAMMGVIGLKQTTAIKRGEEYFCPEFEGAELGLFLQKKLMTKSNGDNSYGFEIKVPFCPKTRRTMREIVDNKPATTIDNMAKSYADIDDRKQAGAQTHNAAESQGSPYPDGW